MWRAEDAGPRKAEAGIFSRKKCKSPSKTFRGPCSRDSNCDTVCRYEGYPAGNCHGLRRRCICCTHA
uniref:Knottins-like domain-containing protein n=1 Tax=Chenopodium quinoa TaxID=63459 RepID=A0A803L8Y3_CHEQI